jgi:hypothetical protein
VILIVHMMSTEAGVVVVAVAVAVVIEEVAVVDVVVMGRARASRVI